MSQSRKNPDKMSTLELVLEVKHLRQRNTELQEFIEQIDYSFDAVQKIKQIITECEKNSSQR
jgi:hypothetical protein